jgi:hypothetical protein
MVCLFVCEERIENIFDLDTWDWSKQTHKLILAHLLEGTGIVCLWLPRKRSLDVIGIYKPRTKGKGEKDIFKKDSLRIKD